MEIDLSRIIKPAFQLKLFMTVFWIVFLIGVNGVQLDLLMKVIILIGTTLLVIGWFKYPYPINTFKVAGENDTNEESDNKEETIKYT